MGNWLQFLLCGVRRRLHLIEQFGSCLGLRCGELQQNVGKVFGKRFETGLARPRIRRLAQLGTALSTCRRALGTQGCRAGQGKVTRCASGFSELDEQDRGLQANTRVRNPHCSHPGCATHLAKGFQLAPLCNLCSFFPAVSLLRLVLITAGVSPHLAAGANSSEFLGGRGRGASADGAVLQNVGCDYEIDSNAVEDRCGVCHGDGSTCHTVKKMFEDSEGLGKGARRRPQSGTPLRDKDKQHAPSFRQPQPPQGPNVLVESGGVSRAGLGQTHSSQPPESRKMRCCFKWFP